MAIEWNDIKEKIKGYNRENNRKQHELKIYVFSTYIEIFGRIIEEN